MKKCKTHTGQIKATKNAGDKLEIITTNFVYVEFILSNQIIAFNNGLEYITN